MRAGGRRVPRPWLLALRVNAAMAATVAAAPRRPPRRGPVFRRLTTWAEAAAEGPPGGVTVGVRG